MRFQVCKVGETTQSRATVTLDRGRMTLVVKGVPAEIRATCGEEYLDGPNTAALTRTAEEAFQRGTQVEVREYAAA